MSVRPSTLTHANLHVSKKKGARPGTRRAYQVGGVSTNPQLRVFNNTIHNLERGVLERVFYVKSSQGFTLAPSPLTDNIFNERLSLFKKALSKTLIKPTRLTRQQFVDGYTGRKKVVYERAAASLLVRGLVRSDSNLKVFVKGTEKTNVSAKPDPVPRIISPRDPRYGCELGRYIKPIEHMIYAKIGQLFGSPTISKGYNAQQVGNILHAKWKKFAHPVAIGLDASRFDQHVSVQALKWEHSIYQLCFPNDEELRWLLAMQLVNKAAGYCPDGRLRYKVKGKRCSGDMNTALGNCLLMCAMIYAYAQHKNVTVELINNGDDCSVIMEESDRERFSEGLFEWFLEMGFNMKIEKPVYYLERVEFCQTQPIFDGKSYIMVRNPIIGVAKDSICTRSMQSKTEFEQWTSAVGTGGLSLAGGIPVFQSFYQMYVRTGQGRTGKLTDLERESGFYNMRLGMNRQCEVISAETRVSFWLAFGIEPDHQLSIEQHYDSLHPLWQSLLLTDRNEQCTLDWAKYQH